MLFSLVIAIAILVLSYFIAKWFFEVVEEKGYHDKKYFWICFWLGLPGWLLVIALPNRGMGQPTVIDDLPEI